MNCSWSLSIAHCYTNSPCPSNGRPAQARGLPTNPPTKTIHVSQPAAPSSIYTHDRRCDTCQHTGTESHPAVSFCRSVYLLVSANSVLGFVARTAAAAGWRPFEPSADTAQHRFRLEQLQSTHQNHQRQSERQSNNRTSLLQHISRRTRSNYNRSSVCCLCVSNSELWALKQRPSSSAHRGLECPRCVKTHRVQLLPRPTS